MHSSHHKHDRNLTHNHPHPHHHHQHTSKHNTSKINSQPELLVHDAIERRKFYTEMENYRASVIEGEKRVLIFVSIPIVCIALISFFHIIVDHAPYFNGDCRHVDCVAGSNEQFAVWTILFILLVYALSQTFFRGFYCMTARGKSRQ